MTNSKKIKKIKENIAGYLFLSPQLIGILTFIYFGVAFVLVISFTNWNFNGGLNFKNLKWIGLSNYKFLLKDDRFISALATNFFMVAMVPVTAFLSLLLGHAINTKYFFERGLRAAIFIPNVCSMVAIVVLWSAIFQPRLSPVSSFISSLGFQPPEWFSTPWNARVLIYTLWLWKSVGYYAFIYLGGLNSIPNHLYESAEIDGAGPITKFFRITLPLVSPTTLFVIITGVMSALKEWTHIYLLTGGSPGGSTNVFGMLVYKNVFPNAGYEQDLGAASAVTVILLVLAFVIMSANWKLQDKWVNYTN